MPENNTERSLPDETCIRETVSIECPVEYASIISRTIDWLTELQREENDLNCNNGNVHNSRYQGLNRLMQDKRTRAERAKKCTEKKSTKPKNSRTLVPITFFRGRSLTERWMENFLTDKWFIVNFDMLVDYLQAIGLSEPSGKTDSSEFTIRQWGMTDNID